jgi:hypothetical protein
VLKPGPSQEGRQFKEARIEGKSAEGSGQGKEEAGKKKVVEGREVVEEAVGVGHKCGGEVSGSDVVAMIGAMIPFFRAPFALSTHQHARGNCSTVQLFSTHNLYEICSDGMFYNGWDNRWIELKFVTKTGR